MYWSLIPSVAKGMKLECSTSNAAAERLLQSAVYKRLVSKRRCLIPINGFYDSREQSRRRHPFTFT
jgi:putative SOS response-associated peptidase YedK